MIAPPLPSNEALRLRAVHRLGLLDSKAEERFDRLTRIAARLFNMPIALITLVDEQRQWFKSAVGIETCETGRDISICGHTILAKRPLIIHDTLLDLRFHDNPAVTGTPNVRFYAGIPLETEEQMLVGTLCVIDTKPREFGEAEIKMLEDLAALVLQEMAALGTEQLVEVMNKSEESFSGAFAYAAIGMALVSPEGHWLKVNQAVCDIIGYTAEEMYQKTFQDITYPEDLEADLGNVRLLLDGKIPHYAMEKRYFHKDGHLVWVNLSVSLVRDAQGRPLYFISQVQDISERKRAEQELTWKTAVLEAKVHSSNDGVVVVDTHGRKILQNRRMTELWNIPPAIAEDKDHQKQVEYCMTAAKISRNNLDLLTNVEASPSVALRDQVELKNGTFLDVLSSPVIGQDGNLYGRIWSFRDVTEQKLAHDEMERLRHEYERILSAVSDGVHWIGLDGLIKFENPAAAKMLGYRVSELVGRSAHRAIQHTRVNGTPYPENESFIHATLRDGEVRRVFDEVFWRKNGTSFDVEYTCTPIHDKNGHLNGAVVTFVDVTERKKAETQADNARMAAESASRAKTEFLANMSHEIRTPLNGIIGMADLMSSTPLTAEQKDFLETIHASGENLLTIVNDVLDFSKIEFGKLELDNHAFSVLDLIDDVVGLLNFRVATKGLHFHFNIEQGLAIDYLGDAGRIRQVVINLVTNAIKFTEQGEIRLDVSAGTPRPGDKPGIQRVVFQVRDTGIGIPPDRLDRLFKVFSQVDASTTRRYGGSGLGLAICQKLVEMMGGAIHVTSEVNVGSNFSFEVILGVGPQNPAAPDVAHLAGHHVLIVDDNAANRRMLILQLTRWQLTWAEAANASEALALLKKSEPFHAVLIDSVPLGREIAQSGVAHPPLLLISSRTDVKADELKQAGFVAAVAKPVRQHLLYSALKKIWESPAEQPAETPAANTITPGGRIEILVVEDNPTNQKVAQQILKRLGFTCDIANNGYEGVRATEKKAYDLILMDVHMPEMDGLEATRRIRRKGGARRPKIVALTADVLKGEREVCLNAGMDDYLTKPIKLELLKEILEQAAGKKSQA